DPPPVPRKISMNMPGPANSSIQYLQVRCRCLSARLTRCRLPARKAGRMQNRKTAGSMPPAAKKHRASAMCVPDQAIASYPGHQAKCRHCDMSFWSLHTQTPMLKCRPSPMSLPMTPILDIRQLTKHYGKHTAVDGISFA